MGVDFIALSFVRRREDLEPVREHLGDRDIPLIAKIEKPAAASNAEEIIEDADGVMVARGDLGIELPIEEVPLVQKRILHLAGRQLKPSITATQMLESMVQSTRPTRAEVADVANAIFDGTDAVMLSQETAVGRYPVEAVAMMAAIADRDRARAAVRALPDRAGGARQRRGGDDRLRRRRARCYQLGLKAIVVPTMSGGTARVISAHRPQAPGARPLAAARGGAPLLPALGRARRAEPGARGHHRADRGLRGRGAPASASPTSGDKIGITAGLPAHRAGGTNLFKVHTHRVRQFAKLCDVRDFEDADVLRMLRDILPERDPLAHVERKVWEFAMLALFLEETGRLHDGDRRAGGRVRGTSGCVFWLANRIGRVVATDIYGEGDVRRARGDARRC